MSCLPRPTAYGKEGATREEIIEAAKASNAHDFIQNFPNKYDEQVGGRGMQVRKRPLGLLG